MDPELFAAIKTGRVVKGVGGYWAFVPAPLPEEIELDRETVAALSSADRRIGNLNGIGFRLTNPHLLSGAYITREAVLSSRIEGTRSSESDLYLFDIEPNQIMDEADHLEVRNYVTALNYALGRRSELPVSLRLLRETHQQLMAGVRGRNKSPGEFRTSQNWIGGSNPTNALYVPPPVEEMKECLDALEKFLHRDHPERLPALVECALVHYQFEAIHPFLDGNGRIGRLLITLLTIERECLKRPLLYLSAYFERTRDEYYSHLLTISRSGDWRGWLKYFLDGVAEQAHEGVLRAERILNLATQYDELGLSATTQRLVKLLFENPFTTVKSASDTLGVSAPTATSSIRQLEAQGVLSVVDPTKQRGRIFVAHDILASYTGEINVSREDNR